MFIHRIFNPIFINLKRLGCYLKELVYMSYPNQIIWSNCGDDVITLFLSCLCFHCF